MRANCANGADSESASKTSTTAGSTPAAHFIADEFGFFDLHPVTAGNASRSAIDFC